MEMESLRQVALSSGSTAISPRSERRLRVEDSDHLLTLLEQTAARYPHQDLEVALEGYLHDFSALAMRYGMRVVEDALMELRIRPGQRFFPQPSEAAEVAEELMKKHVTEERRTNPLRDCKVCDNQRWVSQRRPAGGSEARECECLAEWRRAKRLREEAETASRLGQPA